MVPRSCTYGYQKVQKNASEKGRISEISSNPKAIRRMSFLLSIKGGYHAEYLSLLSKKAASPVLQPNGIDSTRKENIVKCLGKVMPGEKMNFWHGLQVR